MSSWCGVNVGVCNTRASDLAIIRRQARELSAVRALVEHARKISPSPSMTLYVADVERALGMDAPTPHKLGGNDGSSDA